MTRRFKVPHLGYVIGFLTLFGVNARADFGSWYSGDIHGYVGVNQNSSLDLKLMAPWCQPVYVDSLGNTVQVSSTNPLPTTGGGGGGSTVDQGTGNGGSSPWSVQSVGKTAVTIARHDYQAANVTTAAYTQLVASLPNSVTQLFIFDSSGRTLLLAVGGAGSEVDQAYVVPGGNGELNLAIASGARVSIKAVGSNATKGEINVTFLK